MVTLGALWLPILITAVVVHIASFLAWMVLPHHKSDWAPLPDEATFGATVNKQQPPTPGQYAFPHAASTADWKSEAFKKKMQDGPVGFLILRPTGDLSDGQELGAPPGSQPRSRHPGGLRRVLGPARRRRLPEGLPGGRHDRHPWPGRAASRSTPTGSASRGRRPSRACSTASSTVCSPPGSSAGSGPEAPLPGRAARTLAAVIA